MENLPFAILALTPLVINLIAYSGDCQKFVDAVGMSLFFLVVWLATYKIARITPFPDSTNPYPLLDLIAGALAIASWRQREGYWKPILAALFGLQCINHTAFSLAWMDAPTKATQNAYFGALNPVFVLQGLILSIPGGGYVARLIFDGLHGRALVVHHYHDGRS
jgi:hypothetical protein